MDQNQDKIAQLVAKLELLQRKQHNFDVELEALKTEIQLLRSETVVEKPLETGATPEKPVLEIAKIVAEREASDTNKEVDAATIVAPTLKKEPPKPTVPVKPKGKSNLEKFIGENLINKIGILITIIGVVIGAKYSIENNLISPLTRIVLGYVVGLGLIGFGIKLKAKYENYSAVLVSGALAIMYFITYAGYSFYELFPQTMAFVIMLFFTVFGVVAALHYNKQIIAHIGLVGAYAVPFLLSNDSGNAAVLFGYMAIINIGILVIAFKKHWKPLYYVAFIFTWLIYGSWAVFSYERHEHFSMALIFLSVFFFIFYTIFLAYKLIKSEKFKISDIALLLSNSFIFYAIGYAFLSGHEIGKELLGLFTLANAVVHFVVSLIIYKRKLADRNLFFLASGLVLTFITIAIPVQLDGNWVTLLWALEAVLLFWIGRTKNVAVYEHLSYPLMGLAFLSLMHDWGLSYNDAGFKDEADAVRPFLNITLLTSILTIASYAFVNWIHTKHPIQRKTILSQMMWVGMPALLLVTLYFSFYLEINYYWDSLFFVSEIEIDNPDNYSYPQHNYDLREFKAIWLINYSLLFVTLLAFINMKKIRSRVLGIITLVLGLLTSLIFLTNGLYILSELRESYLNQELAAYYNIDFFNIGIRYVALVFFGLLLFTMHRLIRQAFLRINFKIPFELLMHTAILWVASSELLNWMDISGSNQTYKLGLSILWGVYALLLIVLGIWKKKKYLRVAAISLFGITLIKLFFYDIASLNTISKTIVFVSLGVLLLIISFLYNKYKHVITEDENEA
ncbi:DUF2339 domain-containing protein [Maribacter sp. 2210JD10-5]|uniref:DUF2339 domain-containing protein n=1 Tax=Maribacter sp. 2210JD10-5 TaxID=3386272 RepID=UPI0039BCCB61